MPSLRRKIILKSYVSKIRSSALEYFNDRDILIIYINKYIYIPTYSITASGNSGKDIFTDNSNEKICSVDGFSDPDNFSMKSMQKSKKCEKNITKRGFMIV